MALSECSAIIASKLYLGTIRAAHDLPLLNRLGVSAVVSVIDFAIWLGTLFMFSDYIGVTGRIEGTVQQHNNKAYLIIPTEDSEEEDLLGQFEAAHHFIDSHITNGAVLVHCQMGKSRSATIVISYLMSRHNMTATEAFDQVRRMRPEIDPNFGFVNQLVRFERRLRPNAPLLPHLGTVVLRERWDLSDTEFTDQQLDAALQAAKFKSDDLCYVLYPPAQD